MSQKIKDPTFSVYNETRSKIDILPIYYLQEIKEHILGKKYFLSLVFANNSTSKKLNKKFRNKNYPTNILSFPNTKTSGEIILHLPTIKKDSINFGMNTRNFLGFIFIHGLLHLEGFSHGCIMENKERTIAKKFGFI